MIIFLYDLSFSDYELDFFLLEIRNKTLPKYKIKKIIHKKCKF